MNGWRPSGPTSPNGLKLSGEKQTLNFSTMITPNFHGSPLKNPPVLNGCNGHVKVNHYKNLEIINNHANNHHHPRKNGLGINSHLQLMKDHCCCLRPTLSTKSVDSDQDDHKAGETDNQEEESEDSCGLWSFRPRWLQRFANKKAFLAIFCLTSVLQGMYYTYFVSVLTTIEKLFQIQSKWTGIIMSSTEMGQIFGALLLTYYGGQGHRPKWIAYGMLVFAFAAILCATPHFLFREVTAPRIVEENSTTIILKELRTKLCFTSFPTASEASSSREPDLSTTSSLQQSTFNSSTSVPHIVLRQPPNHMQDYVSHDEFLSVDNGNASEMARSESYRDALAKCDKGQNTGHHHDKITNWVLIIFFVSLLLIGIGATAVYTLGIPYIDDNVATRESPLYFGITIGVRIFGPVFGFLLGSYCTSVYVHPFQDTDLTPDDPQWIGAWWLGVFIVGAALILTTFPMMAFPKKLPQSTHHQNRHHHHRHHPRHHHHHHHPQSPPQLSKHENSFSKSALIHPTNGNDNGVAPCKSRQCHHNNASYYNRGNVKPAVNKHSLKDFLSALKRLVTNVTLMLRTASSVLHILPIAGLYTFLPKYLESQFQLTATKANMIAGMAGILVMGFGIFASGTFMRKFKPSARFVAGWIAIAALAYSVGMIILMWLGCPLNNYVGLNAGSWADNTNQKSCNATCDCRPGEFAPICTSSNITYLAPCLAGCNKVEASAKDQFVYKDCHCLGPNETATNGFCPIECDSLTWYILVFSVFVLIHSTSEVGSMLLTLRCVDPKDKALALGLISFAIGLFGNVPCPIIYGAVVDSACLFWEDNCGEPGACRVYDPTKFRIAFHGVTAGIMLVAFAVDVLVWFKAHNIQFSTEEDEEEGEEEEEEETESLASAEEERPLNYPLGHSNFESSV